MYWPTAMSLSFYIGWVTCSTQRWPDIGAQAISKTLSPTALSIISANEAKVDGIKNSLLDAQK
ncbi:MAG: hypothetical protein ACI9XK_004493 [Granulosicoccus sp.]|jgi:hypothetical protein